MLVPQQVVLGELHSHLLVFQHKQEETVEEKQQQAAEQQQAVLLLRAQQMPQVLLVHLEETEEINQQHQR